MPPYAVADERDAYPGFEMLDALFERSLDIPTQLPTAAPPAPTEQFFSSVGHVAGAAIVAVGIIASVLLFVRHQHQNKRKHVDVDIVTEADVNVEEDTVVKTVQTALPPLVFQDKHGIMNTVEPTPLESMLKRVKTSNSPPPRFPAIYYNAKTPAILQHIPLEHYYQSEEHDTTVLKGHHEPVQAAPHRQQSLNHIRNTGSKTPPSLQMIGLETSAPASPPPELPVIMIQEGGMQTQSARDSPSNSQSLGNSLNDLLRTVLPNKLGESNYRSTHTSTTSVSMLSAKVNRFTVEKPWVPQQDDELPLAVGDIVHVYQVFNDCWCEGFVDGNEDAFGMFPRDCLGEFPLSLWDLAQSESANLDEGSFLNDPGVREGKETQASDE
ncbi:hypothetical protein HDU98_007741 [Podochytrium sp. JEL0797]|nr:hypothetical protein HDU98_007741 [Podochytrium sp. JEL0797]